MRAEHLREWLWEHQAGEAAKVNTKEAEAEAEAEVETSGSESEEKESEAEEGTADGVEERDLTKWEKVVELVQLAFRDGFIAEEAAWQAVVLIPKGGGDYCGIGLLEVIWKVVAVILNFCFTAAITYHDFLHRFRAGCGFGNATLEVKLLRQVAALREAVPKPRPARNLWRKSW